MSNITSCTDDKIGGWIFSGIQICEKFFFCEHLWIYSFCYDTFDSANNFILSTVSDSQDKSHIRSWVSLLHRIKQYSTNSIRDQPEISDSLKPNSFLNQLWYEFGYLLFYQRIYCIDLGRIPLLNIFF